MRSFTVFACTAFVVFTTVVAALGATATVPRLINYQGILTDGTGTPIDGSHDLTFTVYPDSSASAVAIWVETHTGVQVDNGVFNLILGGVVPMPENLFADGDRWLGIAVDGGSEMSPRNQITSVPWALRAAAADSVASVEWSNVSNIPGDIADGDDNTQLTEATVDAYADNNGYIVTEIDPTVLASVKDGVDWDEVNGIPAGFADGVDDVGAGDGHSLDAADGIPVDALYVDNDGDVGIGTTAPARVLHVSDVMRLEPRSTAPSNPSEGDMYMDSTTHKLMVYDGTTWQACF